MAKLPPIVLEVLGEDLEQIEVEIKHRLHSDNFLLTKVGDYVCSSGGKRLRPALLALSSKLCGYSGSRHIEYASIIEFIHAATLLHDDVIDDSHTRRGKASANSKWGNGLPVLVGDYLYSKSFFFLVEFKNVEVMRVVSHATMTMTNGEVLQLSKSEKLNITEEEYFDIITKKTACLISACCKIGAILGNVNGALEGKLASFGENLGIAFQLVDDILDFISDEKVLGKPVGNDLKEGNCTLPVIYALRDATKQEKKYVEEYIHRKNGNIDPHMILDILQKYGAIEYTCKKAKSYIDRAKANLSLFPHGKPKDALISLSEYVVDRIV